MKTVRVRLGERSYDIAIGSGLLEGIGPWCGKWGLRGSCLVVTDAHVGRIYGKTVVSSLRGAGFTTGILALPPGEAHKSLGTARRIYNAMLTRGLDRSSFIVSLGGGVAGDVAGFAAATYMRGISFVQAPTTLLAQVDASVGGKVGVNLPQGKNLIGAFHQPRGVLIDPSVLRTLDRRQLRAGFAELIKHAVIRDARHFLFLEKNRARALALEPRCMETIILRSCQIKAAVVARDERERDLRMILNFGHTLGHALEAATGYRVFLHGEAVAIGMAKAAAIAERLGHLAHADAGRIARLIESFGLRVSASWISPARVLSALRRDKKARGGIARFVLPVRVGKVFVTDAVDEKIIREVVTSCDVG